MGLNAKAWFGGFKRLIKDESLGETLGIAVDNTTKQLHIIDIADADTDWALSADSYPAVYIHGSASASEYIKQYTDSTDAHYTVLGANLDIEIPSSKQLGVQVNDTDEYLFDSSNFDITTNIIAGSPIKINSVGVMQLQGDGQGMLAIDNVAIAAGFQAGTAAIGLAGTAAYISVQKGGLGTGSRGGAGAALYINAGDAGSSTTSGTGAAGGAIYLTAGDGAAAGTNLSASGAGGNLILTPGMSLGTTVAAKGYLQLMGTMSWVTSSTVTATLGTTVFVCFPGSGSLISSSFLTIKDKDGAIRYIPAFVQAS